MKLQNKIVMWVVIFLVIWIVITGFRLIGNHSFKQCHIKVCEKEGLESTITTVDNFYMYGLSKNYASCFTKEGGIASIKGDVKELCK